jgi:hypothetical protein
MNPKLWGNLAGEDDNAAGAAKSDKQDREDD